MGKEHPAWSGLRGAQRSMLSNPSHIRERGLTSSPLRATMAISRSIVFVTGSHIGERSGIRRIHVFRCVAGLMLCVAHSSASAFPAFACPAERYGGNLGCNASDVKLASASLKNDVTDCQAGHLVNPPSPA
jgi:hypothetical protein